MTNATSQDTEITLGTGKMLTLFFGLVALCAVFFGIGFSLGRSSVTTVSSDLPAATTVTTGGLRPSAVKTTSATPPADMTFYKAVQTKDGNSQPAVKDASTPAPDPTEPPAATDAAADPTAPPVNGYFVQVAAVSKPEDAEALVDALKKKQYPAFSINAPTDKLIHVQVGPYADIKDAELMRGKLVSDGYNPILKK
jgi:cell division septation protein DedD